MDLRVRGSPSPPGSPCRRPRAACFPVRGQDDRGRWRGARRPHGMDVTEFSKSSRCRSTTSRTMDRSTVSYPRTGMLRKPTMSRRAAAWNAEGRPARRSRSNRSLWVYPSDRMRADGSRSSRRMPSSSVTICGCRSPSRPQDRSWAAVVSGCVVAGGPVNRRARPRRDPARDRPASGTGPRS